MSVKFHLSFPLPGLRPVLRGWWCLVLFALGALPVHAEVTKEYQLKAAFLYNFTKFIEWPADRFEDETSPIVIGVFGANPFGDELEIVVAGRTVNGRPIKVRNLGTPGEAAFVHVVFVDGSADTGRLTELISVVEKAGVLTVGESQQFAAHGGIIKFNIEGDRVRFEINQASGDRAGLRISAQLLKLASAVHRKG